ncbi:dienelactone hydrolase family protein [Methylobacterium sp. J-068]|uniref:dienelactone hydrolase family protein n=1 Tax=Methylobacterium sp. J-068 TaxID=2836649 RepID=UPI001FBB3976|nr:CocE/NonD family hydrolase [Methylobacterium sp. J-068]MCJ2033028.1 prolyl oligopeptidase family serine peptidase [Methylobacterium sp. J-068]
MYLWLICSAMLSIAWTAPIIAGETLQYGPDTPIEWLHFNYHGDPRRPAMLKTTVAIPTGQGPFPLVVFNHGSNGKANENDMRNYERSMATYYFLSRGYAVAQPLLRGYGGSTGAPSFQDKCQFTEMAQDHGKDILAVIDQLAENPKIDTRRTIMAGASFGGWNALAAGTLRDRRVKVVVNFYGGLRSVNCKASDVALRRGAGLLGKASKVPSIWFYGDNDQLFPKPLWEAMYGAYVGAGGQAEMVAYGKFGTDSHRLLGNPAAFGVFVPRLDAFLKQHGFPAAITHPQYIPLEPPPASRYADLDDVDALPFSTPRNREAYLAFLKSPRPRAFFIAAGRGTIGTSEGYDPLAQGYAECKQHGVTCRLYAFNDDVVWTYPSPPPAPTRFAAYEDADAIPYIDAAGRTGYAKFRALPRPKAFVIAPNGAWMLASGDLDAVGTALERCGRVNPGCKPYAVDGHVVWPETAAASR